MSSIEDWFSVDQRGLVTKLKDTVCREVVVQADGISYFIMRLIISDNNIRSIAPPEIFVAFSEFRLLWVTFIFTNKQSPISLAEIRTNWWLTRQHQKRWLFSAPELCGTNNRWYLHWFFAQKDFSVNLDMHNVVRSSLYTKAFAPDSTLAQQSNYFALFFHNQCPSVPDHDTWETAHCRAPSKGERSNRESLYTLANSLMVYCSFNQTMTTYHNSHHLPVLPTLTFM